MLLLVVVVAVVVGWLVATAIELGVCILAVIELKDKTSDKLNIVK